MGQRTSKGDLDAYPFGLANGGVPLGCALALQWVNPEVGRSVNPEFYVVMAQVIPVFLLGAMFEVAAEYRAPRDPDHARFLRSLLLGFLVPGLCAEVVALVAVAADATSTFLLTAIAFYMLFVLLMMVRTFLRRFRTLDPPH